MSVVDSEASFAARCSEVCGDSNLHAKLIAADIKTYSNLAFSCGTPRVQPNEAVNTPQMITEKGMWLYLLEHKNLLSCKLAC